MAFVYFVLLFYSLLNCLPAHRALRSLPPPCLPSLAAAILAYMLFGCWLLSARILGWGCQT